MLAKLSGVQTARTVSKKKKQIKIVLLLHKEGACN